MKIALIQLSDIHLTEVATNNPVLKRGDLVVRAVDSVCHGVPHGILALTGDTAYSGKEAEYQHGKSLVGTIAAGLAKTFGGPVPLLTIAGNHDCDFNLADNVRGILLEPLKPDRVDASVIDQCTVVQRQYQAFAASVGNPPPEPAASGVDRIYSQVPVNLGGRKLLFHLLNSAWMSQLKEKAGGMYFPVRLIKDQVTEASQADLVVSALHHPFNWYWPDNMRELRKCLEDHSDLILTGHEHVAGAYGKLTDAGEQNEYLEGGVLQETGQPAISSFNVVLLDIDEQQQQTHRFVWRGDHYGPEGEPFWRPFQRNKRLTRNQFDFDDQFFRWLEDPGAGYTHPQKEPLTLSDIFLYPDLQEIQYRREASEQVLVRSRDVVSFVLNSKSVILVAEEKAGKSSLGKSLVKDLHKNGKIPVLLNGESLGKALDGDRLKKAVNDRLNEHYGKGHTDRFWQLDAEDRVAVVDDFHKADGNRKSKDKLVTLLRERFGLVVLLAGEEFRIEELTAPSGETSPIGEFKQCNVLPFGHALRHALVSKWCRLGREYTDDEAEIERVIKRSEEQISTIISIDFLPSFPVFILILLQQLESTAKLTTTSGSFGYLYEVLVTTSLSRRKALQNELDGLYTYLSEFAYHLFTSKTRALTESKVRTWHNAHCDEYRLPMPDFRNLWQELAATGVIDFRQGEYKFRYKYLYYFFVARYFRDNINKPEIQDHINHLSLRLYHEMSANIMIFLCHLSKDERVLGAMVSAAKSLFSDAERFDVGNQGPFLTRIATKLPQLVLQAGTPAEHRQKALEKKDEEDRKNAVTKKRVVDDDEDVGIVDELLLHNAAFKTIQILGQVLKNFSGSLKGKPKRQLVEECYGLGLRVLGNIFHLSEVGFPALVDVLAGQARAKDVPPPTAEIEKWVSQIFFGLLQMLSYSVFKHVSDSVGTEKVAQTFEEVATKDSNSSVKVIDLAIRLDHYDTFPKAQITALVKEFSGNEFAMAIIRRLVWYHLYLFTVDYREVQFACEKLEIAIDKNQPKLLTAPKKSSTKRKSKERKADKDKKRRRK